MDFAGSVTMSADEETQLAAILRCETEELPGRIAELGKAAVREYLDMILSEAVVRSPEVREHRLLLLITQAFSNRIPDEGEVGRLFNLSRTSARSLLRSVISRRRYILKNAMALQASSIIESCELCENGDRRVAIKSAVVVEFLNEQLGELDGSLKRVFREKMTGNYYIIPEDSFNSLQSQL